MTGEEDTGCTYCPGTVDMVGASLHLQIGAGLVDCPLEDRLALHPHAVWKPGSSWIVEPDVLTELRELCPRLAPKRQPGKGFGAAREEHAEPNEHVHDQRRNPSPSATLDWRKGVLMVEGIDFSPPLPVKPGRNAVFELSQEVKRLLACVGEVSDTQSVVGLLAELNSELDTFFTPDSRRLLSLVPAEETLRFIVKGGPEGLSLPIHLLGIRGSSTKPGPLGIRNSLGVVGQQPPRNPVASGEGPSALVLSTGQGGGLLDEDSLVSARGVGHLLNGLGFKTEVLDSGSWEEVRAALVRQPWSVVHYVGHIDDEIDSYETEHVRLGGKNREIRRDLPELGRVSLVFIDACNSMSAKADGGESLAALMHGMGASCVIGSFGPLPATVGHDFRRRRDFAQSVYTQIGHGESIGSAVRQARLKDKRKRSGPYVWPHFGLLGDPETRLFGLHEDKSMM